MTSSGRTIGQQLLDTVINPHWRDAPRKDGCERKQKQEKPHTARPTGRATGYDVIRQGDRLNYLHTKVQKCK